MRIVQVEARSGGLKCRAAIHQTQIEQESKIYLRMEKRELTLLEHSSSNDEAVASLRITITSGDQEIANKRN